MPVIYIPVYEHGRRTVWKIVPRWNCFADRSNPHAVFIDGYHFHENQMFRSREAVSRHWAKMPVPAADRFTVAELVEAWEGVKK